MVCSFVGSAVKSCRSAKDRGLDCDWDDGDISDGGCTSASCLPSDVCRSPFVRPSRLFNLLGCPSEPTPAAPAVGVIRLVDRSMASLASAVRALLLRRSATSASPSVDQCSLCVDSRSSKFAATLCFVAPLVFDSCPASHVVPEWEAASVATPEAALNFFCGSESESVLQSESLELDTHRPFLNLFLNVGSLTWSGQGNRLGKPSGILPLMARTGRRLKAGRCGEGG
ncbi:hypothetical protein V8E36_001331 [Tilletia maclaganii]